MPIRYSKNDLAFKELKDKLLGKIRRLQKEQAEVAISVREIKLGNLR